MGLPFGQRATQPGLVFLGRHQPLVVIDERVRHRLQAKVGLDLSCEVECLVNKPRRADEVHIAECQIGPQELLNLLLRQAAMQRPVFLDPFVVV